MDYTPGTLNNHMPQRREDKGVSYPVVEGVQLFQRRITSYFALLLFTVMIFNVSIACALSRAYKDIRRVAIMNK